MLAIALVSLGLLLRVLKALGKAVREGRQRKEQRRLRDRRYFGEDPRCTSRKHRAAKTDEARLSRFGLPVIRDERELAEWFGVSLPRLRWFSHQQASEAVSHYVRYKVPKRSGGERIILAPKRELKALQRKILRGILGLMPPSETAHGFVPGRSIVTNATPHVGQAVVLNLDLKDFFPSMTLSRVRGLFVALGYSYPVASTLALLCTECEREVRRKGGRRAYCAIGPRRLVQGAPTSPAIANLVSWRLDRRLAGLARKQGFAYTRYADDLTFSGDGLDAALRLLSAATHIVNSEGWLINPAKTRLYRRSSRQVVTGLVVNDRVGTPRRLRRRVRAILHNADRTGLQAQNREGRRDFRRYVAGLLSFIHAARPEQATRLKRKLDSTPN